MSLHEEEPGPGDVSQPSDHPLLYITFQINCDGSESMKAQELKSLQHDVTPHEQEPCPWNIGQAPNHHFDYIMKISKAGQIIESTYLLPSGA